MNNINGAAIRNQYGQLIVPCRYCGYMTNMIGTRLCDNCWELERRIARSPELAEKILKQVKEEK